MEKLKDKVLFSAAGVCGGLAGFVSAARCTGNACTSCLGCAGMGISILLAVLLNTWGKTRGKGKVRRYWESLRLSEQLRRNREEERDGMA